MISNGSHVIPDKLIEFLTSILYRVDILVDTQRLFFIVCQICHSMLL